jgi:hypothetical protein
LHSDCKNVWDLGRRRNKIPLSDDTVGIRVNSRPLDIEKKRLWQSKESDIVALQVDICADIGGTQL